MTVLVFTQNCNRTKSHKLELIVQCIKRAAEWKILVLFEKVQVTPYMYVPGTKTPLMDLIRVPQYVKIDPTNTVFRYSPPSPPTYCRSIGNMLMSHAIM